MISLAMNRTVPIVGSMPPELATGSSGTILASPPGVESCSWAFIVDGCRHVGIRCHHTLTEAEFCSNAVRSAHHSPTKRPGARASDTRPLA
jgi:hypothetical protein